MIIELSDTTTSVISRKLVSMREDSGVFALTRVLTLIVSCGVADKEEAIEAANLASNEHPMRIIVVVHNGDVDRDSLDAEVRVGSDAGASEVIVLSAHGEIARDEESLVTALLLPDAPVVVWWPSDAPENASTSPLGRLAQRRITDALAQENSLAALDRVRRTYAPGDTDLSWTRLTGWRTQITALIRGLDPASVTDIRVAGPLPSASIELLMHWLSLGLGHPVQLDDTESDGQAPSGIASVRIRTAGGDYSLERIPGTSLLRVSRPEGPVQEVAVPRRSLSDAIAEELRRLDPDQTFGTVLLDCTCQQPHARGVSPATEEG